MKKGWKIFLVTIAVLLTGGIIYWQLVKKGVIRNVIEKAVSKGTDADYYVKYESSSIDEINGNATFNNIVLQSDSLQQKLYLNDTSVSATIFNVRIGQLKITGANIPSFLKQNKVQAKKIEIIKPVITIIQTGKEQTNLSAADSLALYDRLTGKFKSIQAEEITITDGIIAFANGKNSPHTTLQDVYINLKNLKIDSTRNYDNLVSYFVKDIVATVKTVTTTNKRNGNLFVMEGVQYDAPGRFLLVDRIFQKDIKTGQPLLELKGSTIRGISTNEFIINRRIRADSVTSNGGIVSIYRSKQSGAVNETIEIDNDFFDEAWIKNIRLGNTTLNIYNRSTPGAAPLTLKNIQFNAADIAEAKDGSNLKNLIANSNWNLSGDGISMNTADKNYKLTLGKFVLDKKQSTLRLNSFSMTPLLSEAAFMKQQKFQKDQYNLSFNNLLFSGVDIKLLLNEQRLEADRASLQPNIKIFNDRTLPFDTASKIGMYPQQQLYKLDIPIYIGTIVIQNGHISYRERGRLSTQIGNVFFSNINGTVSNVTNINDRLAKNNVLLVDASGYFLGLSKLSTVWRMPINSSNGAFNATGSLGAFDASKLNSITEPLGMATIERGNVKSFRFGMSGDNYGAKGDASLIYDNLKIKLLKNKGEPGQPDIQKKTVTSFVANLLMKDKNPSNGVTRAAEIDFRRDTKKSFFNLLWKSVFQGAKKVATGKNDGN
ncbi:MAG: hypothetical protein EOO06_16160 [Chitinophagaceae bacterium]|nr:MAG: hypothetical protein EOO06_16160 [Chitinophagaceae bacterium]